ncbi:sugar ABC transporter substrate-binding protein [Actinoallomurus acaciae]|uniref:Sugar ABC transporter substrate-binding protein n=1 Tax=Actinoallomurus acaciae TaxID=502577 RepID=A0ABV5YSJ9_9ACTN
MPPRRWSRRRFGALMLGALAFPACSTGIEKKSAANTRQRGALRIGAIMYARDLEYWQLMEAGMREAARRHGVPISVEVSNRQLATEAQLIDTSHARGDNVLVVAPLDAKASVAGLRKAHGYGMSIVQIDTRVSDPSFADFVGVSNDTLGTTIGRAAATYLRTRPNGKGKIALLTGDTEPNGPVRKKAFLAQVAGAGTVVTSAEAVGSPEAGSKALETVLQAHPDIDLVWAWNGAALQGAVTAASRVHAKAAIFGIDMSAQVAKAMLAGGSTVKAVADQNAYRIGGQAVDLAVAVARGEKANGTPTMPAQLYQDSDAAGLRSFLAGLKKGNP